MDFKIDILKEEIDFTDSNDKSDKLKKSYLILKQKVCRSHDLIKLYNDKLKECERMKIDLDLANKETKKMTSNYNGTLAKVIKLELQNTEYKKNIESLSNTIAIHETKMAGDRQHLQQVTCKMKEIEEKHMDKIMQLDLDKSLLQETIKELKCQLKISNKSCDSSKRQTNKRQQNVENNTNIYPENTPSTVDVAVNTEPDMRSTVDVAVNTISNTVSTVDVAVNTVGRDIKLNTVIEKGVMTDISCNIDKDDLYPLFCNECESILSEPYDKICRSMTKHPRLIEIISSPIKSLHRESTSSIDRGENVADYHANNEICNFGQSSRDINVHNNIPNPPTVLLKPELSLENHHIIRSKPFIDLATNPPFSNQFNGLSNVVQTPCLISESNNLSNLTTSTTSVHVLEKLEEKMKRLEKKIKKQSRKKKQLSANPLQYFPQMNCYPNDILSHNLSLNMASTFWNEVKNLMNKKKDKRVKNQKKRHESKVCKFSSKKIKLKQRLRQNNILLHNNVWNIDSIAPRNIETGAVDNSITSDHSGHSSVDVLSNLTNNDTALHDCLNETNSDKDKCCDTIIKENVKNTILFSTPKQTLHAVNVQDEESPELSLCENMKDNISNSTEDINLSDSNDIQSCTSTVKITTNLTDDIPFTVETFDIENKNCFENKITNTSTTSTTATTTTATITTSATTTATTNDTTIINGIIATRSKASTTNISATIIDDSKESETDEETSIHSDNEFSNTEFTVVETSEIINNVSPNDRTSNSINENKISNCTTIAANSITVTNTCPITNFTTTVMCLTTSITTTTSNVSTNCGITSTTTTTPTGIVTRAKKRKLECSSQMDLSIVKRNSETVCNVENNGIRDNKITKDQTSRKVTNNTSDGVEDSVSRKKQRIAHEMKISNNQEVLASYNEQLNANQSVQNVTVAQSCNAINSVITCTNLDKSNNYNDTSNDNVLIRKEEKSIQATIINSSDLSDEYENDCTQEQSNDEDVKPGHSNYSTMKLNNDLNSRSKFPIYKPTHIRLMDHLKNLKIKPPSKISDLELFGSNELVIPGNSKDNEDKCTSQNERNRNSEVKHNLIKSYSNTTDKEEYELQPKSVDLPTSQIEYHKNSVATHNLIKSYSNIIGKEKCKLQPKSVNLSKSQIEYNQNSEATHNLIKSYSNIMGKEKCKLQPKSMDLPTSQVEYNKNSEATHDLIKSYSNIMGKEKCKLQPKSMDLPTSQIVYNKNSEVTHNLIKSYSNTTEKEECILQPTSVDLPTSQIEYNKNSEVTHNLIKSYSNTTDKEECILQPKSANLRMQRIDGMSQQEKSDLCSDTYEQNIEKHCNATNTAKRTRLEKIKDEAKRFSWKSGTDQNREIHLEASRDITNTIMIDENNINDQSHNLEIFTPENINNNASTSSAVLSPVMLLENHFNKNTVPKGLRTTKKKLREMTEMCKVTDNFVKRQLHRALDNNDWATPVHDDIVNKLSSMCTVRIVANGIVEFMLERAMHSVDNSFTPPAPVMTPTQQRITALLVDLEPRMPTVIKFVQAGIEYKIFRLNKTPMLHQIHNLIRLYVVLARIQKDREKVRMLCCDALYCLGLHAIPVVYTVLTSWPEAFPQFTENTDLLPICMAHIIVSFQAIDYPQLHPLKHLISTFYKFKAGNYLTKTLMEQLLSSLEENDSSIGVGGLKTAIILLAKKEGTSWTYTNVIQANLLPRIVNRKYSSMYEAFGLLGHLLRSFPVNDNNGTVKKITEQLSDLIESGEGSEDQQEGIVSALLSLARHNFVKVSESVMKWKPTQPLRITTIDQYNALFNFRSSMHWKGFLNKSIKKKGRR